MNNQLTIFNFNTAAVRVVTIQGKPWFVAKDVCDVLGLQGFASKHTKRLVDGEVMTVRRDSDILDGRVRGLLFARHAPSHNLVNESGLYALVLRSDKPEAQRFRQWVTSEVLPAIRKDGMYVMGEEKVRTGEMTEDELVLKAMTLLTKKVERLTAENQAMRQEITVLTVDEFAALNHQYLKHAEAVTLGKAATKLCLDRGITVSKQPRTIKTREGKSVEVTLNVYPAKVLYEAAMLKGIQVGNNVRQYLQ